MKHRNSGRICAAVLLTIGTIGAAVQVNAQMGMGTMDRHGMREMMQRMMPGSLPPGIDPALLPEQGSAGAAALERYCAQCHALPGPGMHTPEEWPAVLERMSQRMRMMQGMMGVERIPEADGQIVLRYLQSHAQKRIDPSRYPDLAGSDFEAICAQCHALPDPAQHTSDEWPAVVARMRKNIETMGRSPPSSAQSESIVRFLQRHAHTPPSR